MKGSFRYLKEVWMRKATFFDYPLQQGDILDRGADKRNANSFQRPG